MRFYEFMSQIVDYDDADLEKLSLYSPTERPPARPQPRRTRPSTLDLQTFDFFQPSPPEKHENLPRPL